MIRVRRPATLVSAWRGPALVIHNYATRRTVPVTPLLIEILDYCRQWRTPAEVRAAFPRLGSDSLHDVLRLLITNTLLDSAEDERPSAADPIESWDSWHPAAAFFHFSTKDVRYEGQESFQATLVEKAKTKPPPPAVKSYGGREHITLAPPLPLGGLDDILRARRTWRRFSGEPLDRDVVATLLNLTWGVQHWAATELGPCPLKTSPSGGARHPIEVYLLARAVSGLAPGGYYYDPDAHRLVPVKAGLESTDVDRYLSHQSCYADAPAIFVMTAVFAREQWRYEFPRAYRVVLLDAGHLCQTFCLTATALGLAPFCTAALSDTAIERDLQLDGITESVVYACGAGHPPRDTGWAPWPDRATTPELTPPRWRRSHTGT